MNYRHAYHAGNFADCFKHALLIGLLDSFARKPSPCFVLDTHAGAGWYDLDAEGSRDTCPRRKPGYGVCWGRGRRFWSAILSL